MAESKLKGSERWRPVLEAELKRWSMKSCDQLAIELRDEQVYEIELNGEIYQVEVQLLENTDKYLHVGLAVDNGSVPASFRPLSSSFIREKPRESDRRMANEGRPTTNDQRPLP